MKKRSNECSPSLKLRSHLKLEALMYDSDSFPCTAVVCAVVEVCARGRGVHRGRGVRGGGSVRCGGVCALS